MPAGLHPADSLNQLRASLGIPNDSISSKSALVEAGGGSKSERSLKYTARQMQKRSKSRIASPSGKA
jgi:hypothetical protein